MIKLGVIGYPLNHTLSPDMHNSALKYLGIEGHYYKLETPPEDLVSQVKYLKVQDFTGFNITIPLKVWITPLLNSEDDIANIAGAVNTVIIDEGKNLHGYNTDVYGFVEAIPAEIRENLKSKRAAVLGSGGAARAVAVGLAQMGLEHITFYSRNERKATSLKDAIANNFPLTSIEIKEFNEFADLSYASIVVNSTPVGMQGNNQDISPITKKSVESLPQDALVYDLVYRPQETRLLHYAKNRGLATLNGVEMLVLQGAKALSLWINRDAPVDVMRQAVLDNL